MVNSKFVGKVYDGYEVIHAYERKKYQNDNWKNKHLGHSSYSFVLVNYQTQHSLVLSGRTLKEVDKGNRTIYQILNSNSKGSNNPYINNYKKSKKKETLK